MNLAATNQCKVGCTHPLIENFSRDYINYVNPDIFKAINFFKKNGMHSELLESRNLESSIINNITKYLDKIIIDYNPKKINRLGDMHSSKCTLLIEGESNRYIFKPMHCHFLTLINEFFLLFNKLGDFDYYILKIISANENQSQIEFIENEEINNINKFSYHYGGIIFLLTLLRGTDFHSDNIFVVSSTPVIVDFETLFYPRISEFIEYDVTATSLIKTKTNFHVFEAGHNLNHEMIVNGINSAYELAEENKETIAKFIDHYHSKSTRVIFKPTSYYFDLLKKSSHPTLLITPNERRNYLVKSLTGKRILSKVIMEYEIEDLMNFDIPSFYFRDSCLYSSKNVLIQQNIISS
jgi:lantibiotic modifying enzyme